MIRLHSWVILALIVILSHAVEGQTPKTVFVGRPVIKISEGGVERTPEAVPPADAVNLECTISQIGDKYYWASRRNVELVRIETGGFDTYVALNGAGYVRVTKPEAKQAAAQMGETEKRFDYVEHALIGLKSVTYYGVLSAR